MLLCTWFCVIESVVRTTFPLVLLDGPLYIETYIIQFSMHAMDRPILCILLFFSTLISCKICSHLPFWVVIIILIWVIGCSRNLNLDSLQHILTSLPVSQALLWLPFELFRIFLTKGVSWRVAFGRHTEVNLDQIVNCDSLFVISSQCNTPICP